LTEKIDVVKEFIERMKANAKPIYQFIREGKSDEDVVQLHLILANYANTEHTLNILKKQRLELKRNLEEWFMELGGWLMSSEVRGKLRGWNKLDLPKEMKEKFEELLKEEA